MLNQAPSFCPEVHIAAQHNEGRQAQGHLLRFEVYTNGPEPVPSGSLTGVKSQKGSESLHFDDLKWFISESIEASHLAKEPRGKLTEKRSSPERINKQSKRASTAL